MFKPCPFCNAVPFGSQNYDGARKVVCDNCGACGPTAFTDSKASEEWNTRYNDSTVQEGK